MYRPNSFDETQKKKHGLENPCLYIAISKVLTSFRTYLGLLVPPVLFC